MRRVLHCLLRLGIMPKMGKGSSPRHAAQFSRRRFLQNLSVLAAGWPFVKIPRIGASAVSPYAFEEIRPPAAASLGCTQRQVAREVFA